LGQKVPRTKMGQPLIYYGFKVCSGQSEGKLGIFIRDQIPLQMSVYHNRIRVIRPNNFDDRNKKLGALDRGIFWQQSDISFYKF